MAINMATPIVNRRAIVRFTFPTELSIAVEIQFTYPVPTKTILQLAASPGMCTVSHA